MLRCVQTKDLGCSFSRSGRSWQYLKTSIWKRGWEAASWASNRSGQGWWKPAPAVWFVCNGKVCVHNANQKCSIAFVNAREKSRQHMDPAVGLLAATWDWQKVDLGRHHNLDKPQTWYGANIRLTEAVGGPARIDHSLRRPDGRGFLPSRRSLQVKQGMEDPLYLTVLAHEIAQDQGTEHH